MRLEHRQEELADLGADEARRDIADAQPPLGVPAVREGRPRRVQRGDVARGPQPHFLRVPPHAVIGEEQGVKQELLRLNGSRRPLDGDGEDGHRLLDAALVLQRQAIADQLGQGAVRLQRRLGEGGAGRTHQLGAVELRGELAGIGRIRLQQAQIGAKLLHQLEPMDGAGQRQGLGLGGEVPGRALGGGKPVDERGAGPTLLDQSLQAARRGSALPGQDLGAREGEFVLRSRFHTLQGRLHRFPRAPVRAQASSGVVNGRLSAGAAGQPRSRISRPCSRFQSRSATVARLS